MCVDDGWATTDLGRGIRCKNMIVLNELRLRYSVSGDGWALPGPEQICMLIKIRR